MNELSGSLKIACAAAGAAGIALLAGCHSEQADREQQAKEDLRDAWVRQTPSADASHPKSTVVAQGPSPLVYQALEPCTVHIVDTTTGAEIATAVAKKQGLVYVSEETGAFVNGNRVVPGPFRPGHRYAISIDFSQEDSWGTYIRTQPPPAPATSQPGAR